MSPVPILQFGEGDGVRMNLERLVASRLLVQANSGGGKSWALRYMLEKTHGSIPHIVLDSEGEFSTLRESFPYVLAGANGDVPAEPKAAKLLCRRLIELGASAVIDLYELKLQDRRAFVRLFLEELMHLPRTLWTPTLIVIDEAHRFCPEKGSSEATDAVITLCTQGRKRGFSAVLATQRLSKLSKDAAAELLNVLIGRTTLDVDLRRAADVLGISSKDERNALRELDPGEFYAFGPAFGTGVTKIRTGDVETTHPEPGKIGPVAPPAPAEVEKMLGQLEDLPEKAEEEERTIEALERRVADMKAELRRARSDSGPTPEEIEEREAEAALAAAHAERGRWEDYFETFRDVVLETMEDLRGRLERIAEIAQTNGKVEIPEPPGEFDMDFDARPAHLKRGVDSSKAVKSTRSVKQKTREDRPEVEDLSDPQVRILDALATLDSIGVSEVTRTNLALFSRQSPKSSAYAAHVASLEQAGLVRYPGAGMVALTDEGGDAASPEFEIRSVEDLHQAWLEYLEPAQARILRVLLDLHPSDVDRDELAGMAGQSHRSSAYSAHVSSLKQLGAAEYPGPGRVRATELLFPDGLR